MSPFLTLLITQSLVKASLQSANEYYDIYSVYAGAFSKHYGNTISFTGMNLYPIGIDDLGGFPGLYAGFGMGTAFTDVGKLSADTHPETSSSLVPPTLPSIGVSLNLGLALNKNWDIRLGMFPAVDISLPQEDENTTGTLSNDSFLLKPVYHFKTKCHFYAWHFDFWCFGI